MIFPDTSQFDHSEFVELDAYTLRGNIAMALDYLEKSIRVTEESKEPDVQLFRGRLVQMSQVLKTWLDRLA